MLTPTPAYAGNTGNRLVGSWQGQDHPRIRGEYLLLDPPGLGKTGSPPHTRGIRKIEDEIGPDQGITPAYAGNTELYLHFVASLGDHPRIRGEYSR